MRVLFREAANEKAEAARTLALDRRTAGPDAAVQQVLFRPRNASAAQQSADEKVALACVIAGWAPNSLENAFVVEAFKAVRTPVERNPASARPATPAPLCAGLQPAALRAWCS